MIINVIQAWLENKIQEIKQLIQLLQLNVRVFAIGVDPAFGGDCEVGIILTGLYENKNIIVLEDFSGFYKPETWIYIVQKLSMSFENSVISIEINHGGNLITSLFQGFKIIPQRAINSKYERASVCYLMYKNHQIKHLYKMEKLEQEMIYFKEKKKDRVDALVWALLYLKNISTENTSMLISNFYSDLT